MTYTTTTKVSNELGGYAINAGSIPSSSTVTDWITEAEQVIDDITNTTYTTATASSEVYDYDGTGSLFLPNIPVISITKLEKETKGVDGTSVDWEELTEGRINTTDFYVYEDEGEIIFHGTNTPHSGYQNIRATYDYGHGSVPYNIRRLSTLMVAKRVIMSIVSKSATEEGGRVSVGTISVSDPSEFGQDHLKIIEQEIQDLIKNTGKLKVYGLTRRYNR